jgi:hypothetical protein
MVLSSASREKLMGAHFKPSDPLLRIGKVDPMRPRIQEWEVELKIPVKQVGRLLDAFTELKATELDIDLHLLSQPARTFKGKLARNKVAADPMLNQRARKESQREVLAWVRVSGKDIPQEMQMSPELLLSGTEVHAMIHRGNRARDQ